MVTTTSIMTSISMRGWMRMASPSPIPLLRVVRSEDFFGERYVSCCIIFICSSSHLLLSFVKFNPHKDVKLSERNFWIGTFVILGFFTYIMKERPFKEGPTEDARQIIAYRRYLRSQETEE